MNANTAADHEHSSACVFDQALFERVTRRLRRVIGAGTNVARNNWPANPDVPMTQLDIIVGRRPSQ